jgi:nicotinic acid phosphoribosyltransferase
MFYKYLKLHYDIITNLNNENILTLINLNDFVIHKFKQRGGATFNNIILKIKDIEKQMNELRKGHFSDEAIKKLHDLVNIIGELMNLLKDFEKNIETEKIKTLKTQLEKIQDSFKSYL